MVSTCVGRSIVCRMPCITVADECVLRVCTNCSERGIVTDASVLQSTARTTNIQSALYDETSWIKLNNWLDVANGTTSGDRTHILIPSATSDLMVSGVPHTGLVQWVNDGGVLVMAGSPIANEFMNKRFGWSLQDVPCSDPLWVAKARPSWVKGYLPPSIPQKSYIYDRCFARRSLPMDTEVLYAGKVPSSSQVPVVAMPYGTGRVVYIANTFQSVVDMDWKDVLDAVTGGEAEDTPGEIVTLKGTCDLGGTALIVVEVISPFGARHAKQSTGGLTQSIA